MSPWVSDRWANNINYLKSMCVFFSWKKNKKFAQWQLTLIVCYMITAVSNSPNQCPIVISKICSAFSCYFCCWYHDYKCNNHNLCRYFPTFCLSLIRIWSHKRTHTLHMYIHKNFIENPLRYEFNVRSPI